MPLAAGTLLGPYEILGLVGSGGMGTVYRARDPRLGRDVAVKVISTDGAPSAERLRRFEHEARAVASLSHPNVLTVFDVGARDGEPYVVFELLEGETLRERLRGGPLPLRSAVATAVEVCRGLQAAHTRGILHRDLKPENLFLTSDGFVKILDFGLAKLTRGEGAEAGAERTQTVAGVVMGTPAYLSPEQARGQEADARSDIFALGAILYEALSGKRAFAGATAADTISAILHQDPPPVRTASGSLPSPVERVVRRCLAKEPEDRFHSAHDLALALEAVLEQPVAVAVETDEEAEARSPYPGLSSFTEADAGSFFGREGEVEALWGRIRARQVLGVIGPSGAGKTSFVRAGVVASRPPGWGTLVSTPGAAPFRGLGQALGPELAGDPEALRRLAAFDDPAVAFDLVSRWRKGHREALLVVDQFEELSTLNPVEVQERFAGLLGRLAREADVHVLLSLRDDFLMKCADHEPIARVFESLSPLPALSREGLRRALAEPAKARGYQFEDEALVDEMVSSVEGARAALPLLAFAVSRLWEKRDREKKLLTRAAYEEIGGVVGALAQHAEATLDRIGGERQGMVREIFRTLVTAQGTRAVAEREDVLSLSPDRRAAEEVLGQLVDARLLTSYEVEGAEGQPSHHRVEIVHESLVKAWPRLVRWQAQDEEGAVLRDQLKQAAHLWEEKGRTSDLLWTGTAYQEYVLWRERYPGALTAVEEDFARAMAERAQRQRRLRRLVAGSIVAAALVVAAVTGALWRRSEAARERARAEALRAEAGKLLALGRTQLEADPTAALAYARGSLDLYDTPEARRFALEVLWRGPVARILPLAETMKGLGLPEEVNVHTTGLVLSPDGRWLATSRGSSRQVLLFDREGGRPRALPPSSEETAAVFAFGPRSEVLVTGGSGRSLRFWSLPDLREVRTVNVGGLRSWSVGVRGDDLFVVTSTGPEAEGLPGVIQGPGVIRAIRLPDGLPRTVGTVRPREMFVALDPTGTNVAFSLEGQVGVRSLDATRARNLQPAEGLRWDLAFAPKGDLMATLGAAPGEIQIRSQRDPAAPPVRVLLGPVFKQHTFTVFDAEGIRLTQAGPNNAVFLWTLDPFPDAQPALLGRPASPTWHVGAFDGDGRWLVTASVGEPTIEFWPVSSPLRREMRGAGSGTAFTGDGRWLATCPMPEPARVWPVRAADGSARELLAEPCSTLATSPEGGEVFVGTMDGRSFLCPSQGGPPRLLPGRWEGIQVTTATFDATGRRVLASPGGFMGTLADPAKRVLRSWDLPSGLPHVYSVAHLVGADWMGLGADFAPDGSLYVWGVEGVRRLGLPTDPTGSVTSETVHASGSAAQLSRDGRLLLVLSGFDHLMGPARDLQLFDLALRAGRRITTHGARLRWSRLSPSGRLIVTADQDGVVRVGPVTGEEPHLLLGHKGTVGGLALSPDERWIASGSDDALYVWPMPDVTKPPLHTLPHAELLAKLDALTNLRVVRDSTASTGWKLEVGPFAGWKDVPTW